MARRRLPQADAPANPQTESKLLSLPPELRTIIWELVLHVKPASNSALILRKLDDRNGEEDVEEDEDEDEDEDDEEDDGAEENDDKVRSSPRSSVLTFLLTCRFILYEAAGIFYAQHPISFHRGPFDIKLFAKQVRCPARLNGVQVLLLQAVGFEEMTMICAAIRTHFRKLKILRLEVYCTEVMSQNELEALARERPLFKRAISKFPTCVEVFRVKFCMRDQISRVSWSWDERVALSDKLKEAMKDVSTVLPKTTKAEVVEDPFSV